MRRLAAPVGTATIAVAGPVGLFSIEQPFRGGGVTLLGIDPQSYPEGDEEMSATMPALVRRAFLKKVGAVALAVTAGGGLLTACGKPEAAGPAAVAAAKPVESLKIAVTDPTTSAGLDPRSIGNGLSTMVMYHLYDSLMVLNGDKYTNVLADSVQPNQDGTLWTITLRKGVKFHDGRPVTANDVAYSLRTVGTAPSSRASVYADVDLAGIKAVDEQTVTVPLKRPRGDFREGVLVTYSPVFPDGTTDFSKGIGSGPYKLAGVDGQNVKLVANEDYWGSKPQVKNLELIKIADAATRLNAVKSGQVDYAVGISPVGAAAEKANSAITITKGGVAGASALSFSMNQTIAPFDNPNVRKAVRLAVDRKQLTDTALLGSGTVGNDVVGLGLPGYATDLPTRGRDVAEAKKLFQEAGVTELTLRTGDIVPGMLEASKLFQQQLADAGVTLKLQTVPADSYYADMPNLTKNPFQAFYYANRPAALHLAATTTQVAFFNVTGAGPDHWKKLADAQLIVDDNQRANAFTQIERDFYDNGGDVVWGFQEQMDASRLKLSGVTRIGGLPVFTTATAA
ncbi:peptide/nickel transport system substrate-binding protein [Streptomyces sp. 1331.2]|nr:peptide/nickel transport system substrate-binding protein [Streptomyces sp. 1331.2]